MLGNTCHVVLHQLELMHELLMCSSAERYYDYDSC